MSHVNKWYYWEFSDKNKIWSVSGRWVWSIWIMWPSLISGSTFLSFWFMTRLSFLFNSKMWISSLFLNTSYLESSTEELNNIRKSNRSLSKISFSVIFPIIGSSISFNYLLSNSIIELSFSLMLLLKIPLMLKYMVASSMSEILSEYKFPSLPRYVHC